MSHTHSSEQPSSIYVFVVLSLAAFFTMFVFCRRPGITYQTRANFWSTAMETELSGDDLKLSETDPESCLLRPEFVLDAMRHAEIIECETTPEALKIAQQIANRMRVQMVSNDDSGHWQLSLETLRPQVGIRLLDSMLRDANAELELAFETQPASVVRQRGGSLSASNLALLLLASSVAGMFGLVLASRAKPSSVLLTSSDVDELVGVPVVDLADSNAFPEREERNSRQGTFRIVLKIAEVAVAAVFLLMVFNLVTREMFASRFVNDPLAAYGEMLSHVVG